jgi:hypothetical protein
MSTALSSSAPSSACVRYTLPPDRVPSLIDRQRIVIHAAKIWSRQDDILRRYRHLHDTRRRQTDSLISTLSALDVSACHGQNLHATTTFQSSRGSS